MAARIYNFARCLLSLSILVFGSFFSLVSWANEKNELNPQLARAINISASPDWAIEPQAEPVLIAIVDDAFNRNHFSLKGFDWVNQKEIANNGIDDDENGAVDDLSGWDVADSDSDTAPPRARRQEFHHGTFVASIIADLIRIKLGTRDNYPIKFMFVKAVSDTSTSMHVKSGYEGIRYATDNGATIVNSSWNGGQLRKEDGAALNNARAKGVFIVNSVGNFPTSAPSIPAFHPAVFGVAGSDSNGVISRSNYGSEADLAAPSIDLIGATSIDDLNTVKDSGTSFAAPLVSATAALMKLANTTITANDIRDCLRNSATIIDHRNPMIAGKIGAGLMNVDGAIECAKNPSQFLLKSIKQTPKGSLGKTVTKRTKKVKQSWALSPAGAYSGISFVNSISGSPKQSYITFNNLAENTDQPLWSGLVADLPTELEFDSSSVQVELINSRKSDFQFHANYQFIPIDFEKRYCSERVTINNETVVNDGSGKFNYAALSDCEWLLQGQEGKAITIEFSALDIDTSDKLYIFSGDARLQKNLLTTFTGNEPPPKVVVKSGSVLLWLVSDQDKQKQGFSAEVNWINPELLSKK